MEDFLKASLSRETMPDATGTGAGLCKHCNNALAVWRCKECILATPMCRRCMRQSHNENPFHRIQQWNGNYFRNADISEVGTYLLIRHHSGEAICDTLRKWTNLWESAEAVNDNIEQENLRLSIPVPVPVPGPGPDLYFENHDIEVDIENEEDIDDLNDEVEELFDEDDTGLEGDPGPGVMPDLGPEIDPAFAAATLGAYHQVVHSNGIHHIHMVSCQCRGEDSLALDLFGAQLLPASLKRIRTLFTAQVLDTFRLCNLELKASAYQFYQLLRRLTWPMAPSEVINLYREFRRMSRIWHWMKKLKWAGYAGSSKSIKDVQPGELATFCPACPQVGVNIPDNWRDDPAR